MDELIRFQNHTGLLVSVRDADEAEIALAGGADVIDVKEPARGSLGAADPDAVAAVIAVVADRAPVSVAAGELIDWRPTNPPERSAEFASGAAFLKFGLARCDTASNWPARWYQAIDSLPRGPRPVAVVYADWRSAAAPSPDQVLAQAKVFDCPALLVDTWNKSTGDLFDHWPVSQLADFASRVREAGLHLVLAGSLRTASVRLAQGCKPTLIAVRGAVCEGGRGGKISLQRVRALRAALASADFVRRGGEAPAITVLPRGHLAATPIE
jgi:(5-formylfuran-3-yl)methyl phosphate synthase